MTRTVKQMTEKLVRRALHPFKANAPQVSRVTLQLAQSCYRTTGWTGLRNTSVSHIARGLKYKTEDIWGLSTELHLLPAAHRFL
jgi:hypothetical protein